MSGVKSNVTLWHPLTVSGVFHLRCFVALLPHAHLPLGGGRLAGIETCFECFSVLRTSYCG